jgi:hypothetical protein
MMPVELPLGLCSRGQLLFSAACDVRDLTPRPLEATDPEATVREGISRIVAGYRDCYKV